MLAIAKTNYFKVTDASKLIRLINKIPNSKVYSENDRFAFGYTVKEDYSEVEITEILNAFYGIKEILPRGEAVILLEKGEQDIACIMTNESIDWIQIPN